MGGFLAIAADVLQDSVKDTLYLIPFLFVTYLAMEWLEHSSSDAFQKALQRDSVAGPLVGAILGVVPQCGFSAAASTLFSARVVTLGTLIAVFLSTSDEMLPIFIAEQVPLETIGAILLVKIVVGMAAGFAIDAVMRALHLQSTEMRIHELCVQEGCECDEIEDELRCLEEKQQLASVQQGEVGEHDGAHGHEGSACHAGHGHDHGHGHSHRHSILRSAVHHTVEVTVFVFVIVLALNFVMDAIGQDALASILGSNPTVAVLVSALVGLIPNCGASVAIAQLYVDGLLGAGAMMSGLLSAAGIGFLVLFRTNRHVKENLVILAMVWVIASVSGLVVNGLGIVF